MVISLAAVLLSIEDWPYVKSNYIFPSTSTISIATIAAFAPAFPDFVPARSMACSMVSVVNTPNTAGVSVSILICPTPLDTC